MRYYKNLYERRLRNGRLLYISCWSGLKKFKDVLSFLKPKVKARLEELGHPELATEEEPKGNA